MSITAILAAAPMATQAYHTMGKLNSNYRQLEKYATDNSLISFTKPSRVEPLCIVSGDCLHLEYLPDVLQSLQSVFSGYYLQAVAMATQVGDIKAQTILDKFNPDRDGSVLGASRSLVRTAAAYDSGDKNAIQAEHNSWRVSSLAYEHRLPTSTNKNAMAFEQENVRIGMESGVDKGPKPTLAGIYDYLHQQELKDNSSKKTDTFYHRAFDDKKVYKGNDVSSKISGDRNDEWNSNLSENQALQHHISGDNFDNKKQLELDRAWHAKNQKEVEKLLGEQQRLDREKKRIEDEEKRIKYLDEEYYGNLNNGKNLDADKQADYEKNKKKEQDQLVRDRVMHERAEQKFMREETKAVDEFNKYLRDRDGLNKDTKSSMKFNSKEVVNQVREIGDLCLGKMLTVSLGGGIDAYGKAIAEKDIFISIRLMVNTMPEVSLVHLLASGSMDTSLKERYHAWRAGRIDFIRDLVFCQDMITEHKKAMIADQSGIHSEIVRRVNNAKLAGLATRDPSLNVASNLYVISETTAASVERKLGGKLSNVGIRNKIFESGYAMIIVVIDRKWERVTMYHRGISAGTTVSLKDIKISNKGSGPDIADILKAYSAGNSPSI